MMSNANQNRFFFFVAVQVERGIHGLEPSVVTTFPTVKLGDGDGDGGQQPPPVQEESQLRYPKPFSLALPLLLVLFTNSIWTMDQVKLHFATIKVARILLGVLTFATICDIGSRQFINPFAANMTAYKKSFL